MTPPITVGGRELVWSDEVALRARIRRDRRQVYLEWWDDEAADTHLDDPDDVLFFLEDLVDRRPGADGRTVAVLEVNRHTGAVETIRIRPDCARVLPDHADRQSRELVRRAAGGRA